MNFSIERRKTRNVALALMAFLASGISMLAQQRVSVSGVSPMRPISLQ